MNGYRRIKAALEGQMLDRRPVMLHSFMLAAREAGCTMKQYREDPETAALCHIRFVEKYGVDGILFDVDTALMAGAAGAPVDFPEDEPARTHGIFMDSSDDPEVLRTIDISGNIRIQHALETVRILKRYFRDEIYVRGNCDQAPFSLACSLRSPSGFMMDLLMDAQRALQLIDCCADLCTQFVGLMAQAGADMVSNGDSPAGPSMISPEMYRKFALPFEKKMRDEAHKYKLPYLLHICGNTELILDDMAVLSPDAVELDYKTHLGKIHHCFSRTTALFGTVDPSGVITLGTPEDVKRAVREITGLYAGNPRLIVGAGCAIPPTAPEANIRALISAARLAEI